MVSIKRVVLPVKISLALISFISIIVINMVILDKIEIEGMEIMVLRDDIFPFVGGGGKARKAVYYESYLKQQGYNAIVTCGGVQSNHNRAISLMAARNGWKCHLCIQDVANRFIQEKGNALLDRLSGAECEIIKPEETAEAMDRAMLSLLNQGYTPFYVHGGGHDLPGGIAFVEAIEDLKKQCDDMGYCPDYIFHASGTGSTQAGILVGLDRVGWNSVRVIGVSVARQKTRGLQVITEFANMLAQHYGLNYNFDSRVLFCDDYLCGGYECFSLEMDVFLKNVMRTTGLVFDTTYSGKALYGMMDIIRKNNLQTEKVLFWHTGGLMNVMY